MRRVYLLPNLFTALNLFLGFWAILSAFQSQIVQACWLVILAAVLDGLDGAVARLTRTQSEFGLQFDSLSDLVSFGVAPGVLAFSFLETYLDTSHPHIAGAICALFAICGALRLARYNVQAHGEERKGFVGMPIPSAAGMVVVSILMVVEHGLYSASEVALPLGDAARAIPPIISVALPVVVVGLALLMVSEVPYPKLVQMIRLQKRFSFGTLVSLIALGLLVVALLKEQKDMLVMLLFVVGVLYVSYGLWVYGRGLLRGATPAVSAPAQPPQKSPRLRNGM